MTSTSDLLTAEEVSRRLGVEAVTLAKWRSTRKYPLAFVKIGGLVRYSAQAVQDFVNSRTITPGAPPPEPARTKRRYTRKTAQK